MMDNNNHRSTNEAQFRPEITERINQCLRTAVEKHCKVLAVRLDVRFPNQLLTEKWTPLVSELLRRLKAHYDYHRIDCRYVWAREQNSSHAPHFHLLLLFDGSRIENAWSVQKEAARIWAKLLGMKCEACVHLCRTFSKENGIMLRRPSSVAIGDELISQTAKFEAEYRNVIIWSNYLAKTYTKGDAPYRNREFGSSRF